MKKAVTRAIILNDKGAVLLGRRKGGIGAGQWALVGGKPDENESLEEAIKREVKEELGITFEPKQLCQEVANFEAERGIEWFASYFAGTFSGEIKPDPDAITEIMFAGKDALAGLDIAFDHRARIAEFFSSQNSVLGASAS